MHSYVVNDNGHAWPGGTAPRADADQPTQAVDANELVWDFFRQQRRSNAPPMLPFYYDSQLTIPAFIADGRAYTARLGLLAGSPPVFELQLLEPAQAGAAHDDNVYGDGLLTLPTLSIAVMK